MVENDGDDGESESIQSSGKVLRNNFFFDSPGDAKMKMNAH